MRSIHSTGFEKSLTNRTNFGEIKQNSLRVLKVQGSKFHRHQYDSVTSQAELLQRHFPCEAKLNSDGRGTFDAIPQCEWVKRVKSNEDKNLHHIVKDNWRNVSCSNADIYFRVRCGQDVPQKPSSRQWIPVCNKKVKIPKSTVSNMVCGSISDCSLLGKNGSILQGNAIPFSVSAVPSDPQTAKSLSTPEITSVVEQAPENENSNSMDKRQMVQLIKDYCQPFLMPEGFPHLFISAQVAEQAFVSSYRLQMASESAQLATGYPLSEFEKLLCSASPLVASSVSSQTYDGCFNNQLFSPSIHREQMQKISLQSIWDWYEVPGNYGLKVNVNEPQNHEVCVVDTVQFHAYFVPLLSAVQLFGYHNLSSCGNFQESSLEVDDKEAEVKLHHFGNPVSLSCLEASVKGDILAGVAKSPATDYSSHIHTKDGTKPLTLAASSLFSSAELIFEYFESEQPQRRMPLHNKFSVAWYPIYRIPEGNLHAAFLTCHSLGHFFQRTRETDNFDKSDLCLSIPVIGLESYNAQGELWFSANKEVESSLGELTSQVLKERVRILGANALLFARGIVSRDDKMAANRQPDYEFFMSRKQ